MKKLFLLAMALVALSLLALSAAWQVDALAQGDLTRFWRPAYDILVRPAGSRRAVETRLHLVAPNFALSQPGGITPQQVDTIRRVPGVDVAAPIAPLGYLPVSTTGNLFERVPVSGLQAYRMKVRLVLDDGTQTFPLDHSEPLLLTPQMPSVALPHVIAGMPEYPLADAINLPLYVAGIDPQAEARLVGLAQTITLGRYLDGAAVRRFLLLLPPPLKSNAGKSTYSSIGRGSSAWKRNPPSRHCDCPPASAWKTGPALRSRHGLLSSPAFPPGGCWLRPRPMGRPFTPISLGLTCNNLKCGKCPTALGKSSAPTCPDRSTIRLCLPCRIRRHRKPSRGCGCVPCDGAGWCGAATIAVSGNTGN